MPSNIVDLIDPDIIADLVRSGLKTSDLGARPVGAPELAAIGFNRKVDGYVIPYYKINGDLLPFYRIKLLDSKTKYRQPTGSVNHIYFPARFNDVLKKRLGQRDHKPVYVVLTEGEKKAAKGVKEGIPTCAVSGVYSWRNRTMYLPEETKLEPDHGRNNLIKISIPAGYSDIPEAQTLATGLLELIRTVSFYRIPLIICFDTDHRGIKTEVQTAAAQLGYELRHKGIALQHIRQLILPAEEEEKIGLDDYLVAEGVEAFEDLAKEVLNLRVAFPRHPNPREYLNLKLLKGKLGRREAQDLATAILCELDARGRRLHNKGTNSPYYFDEETHTLMPARLLQKHGEPMHESAFGSFLYKNFGISVGDTRLVTWLATQFTGEPPIEDVYPNRIMAQPKDEPESIALQISDSEFVVVRSDPNDPIRICSNGTHGLLFEQDQVDPLLGKEIVQEFKKQNAKKKITPWWRDIFGLMNIVEGQVPADAQRDLATLLFYISPFLYRWRGTQLPAELVIGEADSGKSSLYALRLQIMTGRPSLRNMPNDIRDWYASVINNGGLHVVDNARFINKDLKQRVSDEICRIVTEPYPHIEMRQLYTTASQARAPINCVFAITAIEQPFHNQDIIQRSAVLNFAAIKKAHDGDWTLHQLERYGGRLSWFVHHLVVLHRFLNGVVNEGLWDTEYQATHRLAHYEQCLYCMGEVLGLDTEFTADTLKGITEATMSESDWTLEGIKAFADLVRSTEKSRFSSKTISDWAQHSEEYEHNQQLTNPRILGRYMQSHLNSVCGVTRIKPSGTKNNRKMFEALDYGDEE